MRNSPLNRRGFVDPLYMIFFTVVAIGVALIWPIFDPLLNDKPILLWHWICLGLGVAVLAGCIAFVVRAHRNG
jgi:uncharacterized protein with PQ loop repeat